MEYQKYMHISKRKFKILEKMNQLDKNLGENSYKWRNFLKDKFVTPKFCIEILNNLEKSKIDYNIKRSITNQIIMSCLDLRTILDTPHKLINEIKNNFKIESEQDIFKIWHLRCLKTEKCCVCNGKDGEYECISCYNCFHNNCIRYSCCVCHQNLLI